LRTGIVLAGVVMMVIGLILLSVQAVFFSAEAGGILDLSNLLNPRGYASGSVVSFLPQIAGLGMIIIGFLVFIAGLAASPTEKPQPPTIITTPSPTSTQTTVLAICPNCKARVPTEAKYCNECGADLKPKA
jgi:ribosomal protein L40E